ncbi:MAG: Hsp20/alpha crystallin family protein [Clostridia bacterium]|nr:Hsp20/alpha crystallin family protein [Clostridia bacterium]
MIKLTPFYSRNINAYNPFYEMERLEKAFFGDSTQPVMFKTDISDSGDAYIVESDLPGINKEDIDINIGDGVLTVKAERKYESSDENAGKYLRRERAYGSFERSFNISDIDAENIDAEFKNGVLILTLPKKQLEAPKSRRLEIR